MASRVNASMNRVQAAALDSSRDSPTAGKVQELSPCNNSVLPLRQVRDQPVDSTRPPFFIPCMHNGGRVPVGTPDRVLGGDTPDAGAHRRASGALNVKTPSQTQNRLQPGGTAPGFDPLK
jgi:hypothetical protein